MSLIACNCPNCGGKLEFDDDREQMFCSFCGTKVVKEEIVNVTIFDTDTDKSADWFYDNVVELLLRGRERDADRILEEFFKNYPTDERIIELREFYDTYPCLIAEKGNNSSPYYFAYKDKNVTVRFNEHGIVYDGTYNSVNEDIVGRKKEIAEAEELFEYAEVCISNFPDKIKEHYLWIISQYSDLVEKYKEEVANISSENIASAQLEHRRKLEKEKSDKTWGTIITVIVCIVFAFFFLMCFCCGIIFA